MQRSPHNDLPQLGGGDNAWPSASRIGLLALLMAAPLAFGAVQSWAWGTMTISAAILLLLWAIGCVRAGTLRLLWSPLYLPATALLMLAAAQLRFGLTQDAIGTREALIKLASCLIIFFLVQHLLEDAPPRVWQTLAMAIVGYLLTIAVSAILQAFAWPGMLYGVIQPRWGGYVFGPYVNHNHYAGLMELLLPLAAGSLLSLPERAQVKPLGLFALLVGLSSVLLCGSRSGTLAVLIELAIFLAILAGSARRATPVLLGLVVAILATALFASLDVGNVRQRWSEMADSPEVAAGARYRMAADALHMWRAHPVAGVGLGAFSVAYPPYQSWVTDLVVDHAHDDYAELLAETGAIGGGILIAGMILLLEASFRGLSFRLREPTGWMRTAAAIGCCGLLIHSCTDFNLHIPANAAWFSAAAALASADRTAARRFLVTANDDTGRANGDLHG